MLITGGGWEESAGRGRPRHGWTTKQIPRNLINSGRHLYCFPPKKSLLFSFMCVCFPFFKKMM